VTSRDLGMKLTNIPDSKAMCVPTGMIENKSASCASDVDTRTEEFVDGLTRNSRLKVHSKLLVVSNVAKSLPA